MNLNRILGLAAMVGTWMAKALFAVVAIALVWHSGSPLNLTATAAPAPLIASHPANQAKSAADEVRDRSKDLIRDTQKNVEKTANRNASRVDQSDDQGSFVERKALRDRDRIEQRAKEDAARTEKAVDDSMDTVKGAVETIKDAFRG